MRRINLSLISFFLLLFATFPLGGWAASNGNFYPVVGTPYVVYNQETQTFLHYDTTSKYYLNETPGSFSGTTDVWYFEKGSGTDEGYKIYTQSADGKTKCYVDTTVSNGYCQNAVTTSASAPCWYILRNDYNREGYMVSSDPLYQGNIWYTYYYKNIFTGKGYYNCLSSSSTSIDDGTHGATNYYLLATYRFLTYSDLYQVAKAKLETGETLPDENTGSAANFKSLIAIIAKYNKDNGNQTATVNINGQTGDNADNGSYVIKSRRYDTYLGRRKDGTIYMSNFINNDCIWAVIHDTDKNIYQLASLSGLNNLTDQTKAYLYMNASKTVTADNTYLHLLTSSDANSAYRQISDQYNQKILVASYERKATEETLSSYYSAADHYITDPDWKFVAYDPSTRKNDHVAYTDAKMAADNGASFFRIENNGYRLGGSTSGGWLTDVDHRDMRHYDLYLATNKSNTKPYFQVMPMIDVISGPRVKTVAANLWRVKLLYKGSNGESMIGIVNPHEHNIYVLQNANSGKYLGQPGTEGFFTLIAEGDNGTVPTTAAEFWMEPVSDCDGEYYLVYRDPSKQADTKAGYIVINNDYEVSNKQTAPYTAGLYLSSDETSVEKLSSNAIWDFQKAETIDAVTGYMNVTSDGKADATGPRYVSVYFPFHATVATKGAKLYTARFNNDNSGVIFSRVADVPANKGVFVYEEPTDKSDAQIQTVTFNLEPATSSTVDADNDILTGVVESEDLWFRTPGSTSGSYTTDNKDKYYVFSSTLEESGKTATTQSNLSLVHPLDEYPMANRCFVNAPTTTTAKSVLSVFFDDSPATGIHEIPETIARPDDCYDLTGRRVVLPAHGFYICNGKKVVK